MLIDTKLHSNIGIVSQPTGIVSGIYSIRNTAIDKIYVGKSVNISVRWDVHMYDLIANRHGNENLQSDWIEYGADAFEWKVLEYCEPYKLTMRESHWIYELNALHGYNATHVPKYSEEDYDNLVYCATQFRKVLDRLYGMVERSHIELDMRYIRDNLRLDRTADVKRLLDIFTRIYPEAESNVSFIKGTGTTLHVYYTDRTLDEFKEYAKNEDWVWTS